MTFFLFEIGHNSRIPYAPYSFRVRIRIKIRVRDRVRVRDRIVVRDQRYELGLGIKD